MKKLLATLLVAACGGLAVNSYAADAASAPAGKTHHDKKDKSHDSKSKKTHSTSSKPAKHDQKASAPKSS